MADIKASPADFERLASTLSGSLGSLRQVAGQPGADVDAGVSTSAVATLLATFYEAAGKMSAYTEQAAAEVRNSGGVYTRSDDQAASGMPPLPLPVTGETGGH